MDELDSRQLLLDLRGIDSEPECPLCESNDDVEPEEGGLWWCTACENCFREGE